MLNQVIIVGRIVRDPEVLVVKDGRKISFITLAVNRGYRNQITGTYDTDFINVTLWENLAETTAKHCGKGSIVGIKGRLIVRTIVGDNHKEIEVIGEKVTFISLNKRADEVTELNEDSEEDNPVTA
jgi:single-strand DNA-binding protein